MPEPRTRAAIEIADHASDLHDDVIAAIGRDRHRIAGEEVGPTREHPLSLIERAVAQLEDLAAVVADLEDRRHHRLADDGRQS